MKHAYEPVQISAFTMKDKVYFYSISDALEPIQNITLSIKFYTWLGKQVHEETRQISMKPLSSHRLFDEVSITDFLAPYKKEEIVVEYSISLPQPYQSQTRYLLPNQDYGAFKSITLSNPNIEMTVVKCTEKECIVELSSQAVAAHVMIETDESGYWSDNAFMLIPSKPLRLSFHGYKEIDPVNFKNTLTVMSLWDTYN